MGGVSHPPGTNHFNPFSTLFKPQQRKGSSTPSIQFISHAITGKSIIISDVSLAIMLYILYRMGWDMVSKYYIIPYFVSLPKLDQGYGGI